MTIDNDFTFEDTVYLKHDVEQKPRMVLTIMIGKYHILYEIICGAEVSNHYGFELSKERIVY